MDSELVRNHPKYVVGFGTGMVFCTAAFLVYIIVSCMGDKACSSVVMTVPRPRSPPWVRHLARIDFAGGTGLTIMDTVISALRPLVATDDAFTLPERSEPRTYGSQGFKIQWNKDNTAASATFLTGAPLHFDHVPGAAGTVDLVCKTGSNFAMFVRARSATTASTTPSDGVYNLNDDLSGPNIAAMIADQPQDGFDTRFAMNLVPISGIQGGVKPPGCGEAIGVSSLAPDGPGLRTDAPTPASAGGAWYLLYGFFADNTEVSGYTPVTVAQARGSIVNLLLAAGGTTHPQFSRPYSVLNEHMDMTGDGENLTFKMSVQCSSS